MALTTFKELQRQVQQKIQNSSVSVSDSYNDILPKIKNWINAAYERIIRAKPWAELVRKYTLDIVNSQTEYALNMDVQDIMSVYDVTNGCPITQTTLEDYIRVNSSTFDQAGNILTGDPTQYYEIGHYTTCAPIATAETVSIVSNSASDITPLVVQIRGNVSGVEVQEDVILTGTTAATSTNSYDAGKISCHIGTNDGSIPNLHGVVTVSGYTSTTTFAKIAPRTLATEYKWIKVAPTPEATGTMPDWDIWYRRKAQDLVNNNDMPVIDCSLAIIQGAYADALREDGQEQNAVMADQKFVEMVEELWASRTNPNIIEQMTPYTRDDYLTLDFNRQIVMP
jgi:hypothetical protein